MGQPAVLMAQPAVFLPGKELRGRLRSATFTGLRILGVAAAYYLAARIGLLQELVRGQVTPLWPPTGVAVASLFCFGRRIWPGITLGALVANGPLGPSVPAH
jgi:integral membrane sensor domain MASE1